MTDRRRNVFILTLVAGLLAASLVAIVAQKTRLGLDLKGGVSLVYQAKPTKQTQVTARGDRPRAGHHARARRPARRRRARDPALRPRPDRRLAARRQERRRGPAPGRHDRPAVRSTTGRRTSSARTASRRPTTAASPAGPAAGSGQGAARPATTRSCAPPSSRASPSADDTHNGLVLRGRPDRPSRSSAGPQETERDLREECTEKKRTVRKVERIPAGRDPGPRREARQRCPRTPSSTAGTCSRTTRP